MNKESLIKIGNQYNKLTVVGANGRNKNNIMIWECKCSCGSDKIKLCDTYQLLNGRRSDCGCGKKAKLRKYNTYDLTGEYGIGYTTKGEEFYFDLEDYNKIKDHCWCLRKEEYVVSIINNTMTRLHRLILNINNDLVIDHINHSPRDNRKINLRICNQHQNSMNNKLSKNNTSGMTGVNYMQNINKWRAYIMLNKKQINLGYYEKFDDAVKARLDGELQYFKEYSANN